MAWYPSRSATRQPEDRTHDGCLRRVGHEPGLLRALRRAWPDGVRVLVGRCSRSGACRCSSPGRCARRPVPGRVQHVATYHSATACLTRRVRIGSPAGAACSRSGAASALCLRRRPVVHSGLPKLVFDPRAEVTTASDPFDRFADDRDEAPIRMFGLAEQIGRGHRRGGSGSRCVRGRGHGRDVPGPYGRIDVLEPARSRSPPAAPAAVRQLAGQRKGRVLLVVGGRAAGERDADRRRAARDGGGFGVGGLVWALYPAYAAFLRCPSPPRVW